MRILFAALIVAMSPAALAQDTASLTGNWKLVSRETIVDGQPSPPDLFGKSPKGYLLLTAEGRMALIITGENRKAGMSEAERAELHKSMFAVTGRYKVDGSDLTISVDVSWNEAWTGTELKRHIRLDSNRLLVETAPTPSPVLAGKTVVAKLVFERER